LPKEDTQFVPWNERAYNETVIIRYKDGDHFLTPMKNVAARRALQQGNFVMFVLHRACAELHTGSEIIDKDGVVFELWRENLGGGSEPYSAEFVKPRRKLSAEELAALIDKAKEDPPKLRPWNPQYKGTYDERVTVRTWYGGNFSTRYQTCPRTAARRTDKWLSTHTLWDQHRIARRVRNHRQERQRVRCGSGGQVLILLDELRDPEEAVVAGA